LIDCVAAPPLIPFFTPSLSLSLGARFGTLLVALKYFCARGGPRVSDHLAENQLRRLYHGFILSEFLTRFSLIARLVYGNVLTAELRALIYCR
jgi:hypothetical protein